jgi:hypothetical protein
MENMNETSTKLTSAHKLASHFSTLIKERELWENGELARSNERLYTILQECYVAGWKMSGITSEAKAAKRAFRDFCQDNGIRFKESTHVMARVVRVVFGNDDRRRIHTYGAALKNVFLNKITPEAFVEYVRNSNGIEEIRREGGPKKKSVTQKATIGRSALGNVALGTIESDALNQRFDQDKYVDAVLFLATHEADGTFAIRRMVQKESAVNFVLASFAGEVEVDQEQQLTIQAAGDQELARRSRRAAEACPHMAWLSEW